MDGTSLFVSLLISTVGLAYFIYGKKQRVAIPLVSGLILMTFPYFVESTLITVAIGGVVMALPFVVRL